MADWQQHEWKLLIGGELVAGEAGTAPIVNPATEEVVAEAPEASVGAGRGSRPRRPGGVPGVVGDARPRSAPRCCKAAATASSSSGPTSCR